MSDQIQALFESLIKLGGKKVPQSSRVGIIPGAGVGGTSCPHVTPFS